MKRSFTWKEERGGGGNPEPQMTKILYNLWKPLKTYSFLTNAPRATKSFHYVRMLVTGWGFLCIRGRDGFSEFMLKKKNLFHNITDMEENIFSSFGALTL